MELTHVPVFHVDLEDGRKAAAEARWKPTLGDAHVLDRIRIEHAEKAKQVVHAVQRDAVEEHQVLVWRSPAHIESACALPPTLHARQKLKRLQQIHLSSNGGKRFDLVDGNLHPRHLNLLLNPILAFPGHHSLVEGEARLQLHVELEVVRGQVHLKALGGVAQIAHADLVRRCRQSECVKPINIGGDTLRHGFHPNRGANQRFSRGRVGDVSADGVAQLGLRQQGRPSQHQGQNPRSSHVRSKVQCDDSHEL